MTLNEAITILSEAFGDDMKRSWLKTNPELSPQLIDDYIKRYNIIRNSRPRAAFDDIPQVNIQGKDRFDISKFKDWSEFEAFVDYVAGQIDLNKNKLATNLEIDEKPLVDKNDIEIYYADSPQKCIKYKGNIDYSWCVSRTGASNMYFGYRYSGKEPSFYFVKNKERTKKEFDHWSINKFDGRFLDKYHFFVIQVLLNAKLGDEDSKSYIVTSAQNGDDSQMSWKEILKIEPKLSGMQEYFKPVPLTDEEKYYYNKFKNDIKDEDFKKLSYNEKNKYLDISPLRTRKISDIKFFNLPDDLKNKYIGIGLGLTDTQYEYVKNKRDLYKRYVEITLRKYDECVESNNFDLIKFDSEIEVILSNIEIDKITDEFIENLLNYSRDKEKTIDILLSKGLTIDKILTDKNVYNLLDNSPDEQKTIDILLSKGLTIDKILTDKNVYNLLDNSPDKEKTIDYLFSKNVPLTDDNVYNLLNYSTDKQKTIDYLLSKNVPLTGDNVENLLNYSYNKKETIYYLLSKNVPLTDRNVYILLYNLPDKLKIIDYLLSKGLPINKILTDNNVYNLLNHSRDKQKTIDYLFSKNVPLTDKNVYNLLNYLSDKQKTIDYLFSKNVPLTDDNVKNLLNYSPDKQKTIDILFSKNVPLTDKNVYNLLIYSRDKQKTIDNLLSKELSIDKILTDRNINNLLYYSSDKQKTIDYLFSKNVPLTDDNVQYLLYYSPNKSDTQAKINILKAKQQGLTERHLNYKSFFRCL